MTHSHRISRRSVMLGAVAAAGISPGTKAKGIVRAPLPDGRVGRASGDIVEAVLIGATQRYAHFVLGSRHEAEGVRITTAEGKTVELVLPSDSVFEDREPRIVDLDGDGRQEIVVVRSRQSTGSALAVLGLRDGKLVTLAETPPNGGPQRWLNPAGVGHFVERGQLQIAMVRMPHVVGRLEFWQFDGKALMRRGALDGVSNHRIGSRNLHMSAVIARPGQTDLLAVPSLDRNTLLAIDASNGSTTIVGRAALPDVADGNFSRSGLEADADLMVPLANGMIHRIAISKLLASGFK